VYTYVHVHVHVFNLPGNILCCMESCGFFLYIY